MDPIFIINLIHTTVLIVGSFLWNFFVLFVILKFIFKIQKALFAQDFYFYIIYVAVGSILVNKGFDYIINIEKNYIYWQNISKLHKIGFLIIPVAILIFLNYYLSKKIFKFESNDAWIVGAIMGIAGGPWYLLF